MAPADQYSAPGAARYDSDTMHVGDGTWDFEKNTFLLPNLAGLNFDTMRYNGMGNRFSTVTEYHNLIRAHAVIGAIVFLGLVPAAVFLARFYTRAPGYARHYHGILNGFVILLLTPVFILGWFAVGPNRSWTNPHHVIGLAVYIMFLLQLIGGRIVRNISGLRPSLRLTIHQWSGRLIALLGIIQVPLGLTLYGSPKFTFILFAVWMAILLLAYFILDFRAKRFRDDRGDGVYARGARSEGPMTESEFRTEHTEIREEKSGGKRWIAPLLAAGGLFAFMNRRKGNRSRSASPSSRRGPEVLPSRRGSSSYIEETKYTDIDSRRGDNAPKKGGGGFMKGLFAGKLLSGVMNRQKEPVYADGYSAVSTETPPRGGKYGRRPGAVSEYSDYTVDARRNAGTESLLPPPGGPVMAAHAISAADERYTRPRTPTRVTHVRTQSGYGMEPSDYSSYVSPSRRPRDQQGGGGGGRVAAAGGGILATLGMGWLAKKFADRKARREEERRFREEDDLRSGVMSSRYTGDGYSSPSRVGARKPSGRRPPAASTIGTSVTGYTEDSSSRLEDRPSTTRFAGPPMPPLQAGKTPPQHVDMPPMPPDPRGVLHTHSYSSDAYSSPSRRPERRGSSRRRRAGERAAAAAAASAASTAAEAESYRRSEASRRADSTPVAVKVRVHDDKDRNVTLRRLTEEEAAASRRDQSRRRNDSLGSMSGTESTGRRRYRRDSSQRRAEQAAESAVSSVPPPPPGPPLGPPMGPPPGPTLGAGLPPSAGPPPGSDLPPLSPPQPAFAGGRKPKDSAYYSGQPVPPQTPVGQPPLDASSIGSPESHGTWSGMSPSPSGPTNPAGGSVAASAAADNRRRRRLERRRSTSRRPTGADMFE